MGVSARQRMALRYPCRGVFEASNPRFLRYYAYGDALIGTALTVDFYRAPWVWHAAVFLPTSAETKLGLVEPFSALGIDWVPGTVDEGLLGKVARELLGSVGEGDFGILVSLRGVELLRRVTWTEACSPLKERDGVP